MEEEEEETLAPSSDPPLDLEAVRSRVKVLSGTPRASHGLLPAASGSEWMQLLLEDLLLDSQEKCKQIEEEGSSVDALGVEDLEAYTEFLKKELHSIQQENEEVSKEIGSLTKILTQDSARLDAALDALDCSLTWIDSHESDASQAVHLNGGTIHQELQESSIYASKDHNIEIMELGSLIEKHNVHLMSLMDLAQQIKREATIEKFEDIFSGVKVIDFEKYCIWLLFQAPIMVLDDVLHRQKLGSHMEPFDFGHEIIIELIDGTLQLKNVKIFPADVYLDEVVHIARFSRCSLCSLLRQIQQRILLCSLRLLVVKEVNNSSSRHSIIYSDKDEIITAHLVGGVDAYIKISQGWPILDFGLKLISIVDVNSKSISLSTLCKIKEIANSIEKPKRQQLAGFVDAIEEILVQEMQAELKTGYSNS